MLGRGLRQVNLAGWVWSCGRGRPARQRLAEVQKPRARSPPTTQIHPQGLLPAMQMRFDPLHHSAGLQSFRVAAVPQYQPSHSQQEEHHGIQHPAPVMS